MSSETIRVAIDNYLSTAQSGLIDIAWEGNTYYPNQSTPYLAPRMAALVRRPMGVGSDAVNQWSGNYQISAWYAVGHGMAPILAKVDEILTLFKRGTSLTTTDGLTITFETPSPTPAIQDSKWLHMPILIKWFAYE